VSESPGERRLTAEEVNRLASELDGRPFRAEPVDDDSNVGRIPPEHESVTNSLQAFEANETSFPPEPGEVETIGGSAEDRATLREEESR
jgi:hypothetical protein